MNLTSPSQVKAWCIENEFHPNKTMGQNFLIDKNVLTAIVDAGLEGCTPSAGEGKPLRVMEIGPGLGVLTEEMLSRGCEVVAVEKDPVLAARLAGSLGNPERLTVIEGDAVQVAAHPEKFGVDLSSFDAMVSNLPYQAGTRILLEFVQKRAFPAMTVLVQSEVADRLLAREGSKTRGLAGVWTQLDFDVKLVRRVAASCFWPRPEIGSSVVRLTRHDRNVSFSAENRAFFYNFTKRAFEHRRKQLGSIFKDMIQSTLRAEEISNELWIEICKGLNDENT